MKAGELDIRWALSNDGDGEISFDFREAEQDLADVLAEIEREL